MLCKLLLIVPLMLSTETIAFSDELRRYGDFRDWYLDNICIPNRNPVLPPNKDVPLGMDAPMYEYDCNAHYNLIWQELTWLRNLLDKCSDCVKNHTFPVEGSEFCYQELCFTGVPCRSVDNTPHCEFCPIGYDGDGRSCSKRNPCLKRPCFDGVDCELIDDYPYFECGKCPRGYEGDGQKCNPADTCGSYPCFTGVSCQWVETSPYYKCGSCPVGYEGNGKFCRRNGCLLDPCYTGVKCTMKPSNPFFICGECPVGKAGNGILCGVDSDSDGYPDNSLDCKDLRCVKDNCLYKPNSGQEDTNRNGVGDVCERDLDSDGKDNDVDNCVSVANPRQEDSDGDEIGDRCDNCVAVRNTDQMDLDGDGVGNVCDEDVDGDGVRNVLDNCDWIHNSNQEDKDNDGKGDVCDNCPNTWNDQKDSDGDGVGDVCDTEQDVDEDGIQDDRDNCRTLANTNQLDSDGDGIGDACDDDKDDDGIINEMDNCELVPNEDQQDDNKNGKGDHCEVDFDGDSIPDWEDACPKNRRIKQSDFRNFRTMNLDPEGESQYDPHWEIRNQGAEIFQKFNSDPGLAIGRDRLQGVDFEGTFHVSPDGDDDFVGFVFGYINNRRFYFASWKRFDQLYWEYNPFLARATSGILLKLVDSKTGPGIHLRNSLWHDQDVTGQTKLLWQDASKKGWQLNTAYRWKLLHRPAIGLIRFRLYQGSILQADSGNIFNYRIKGGKLGVYCFSQALITWSNLVYRCNDDIFKDVYDSLSYNQRQKVRNGSVVDDNW